MALTPKYIKTGVFNASTQNGGSESAAYQAANAAEFDHIMRDVLNDENFHIHILAGQYSTYGLHDSITTEDVPPVTTQYGWDVRSNWTITGAGEGLTVIGCVAPVSHVVIENLTVDGNWSNLPAVSRPANWPGAAGVG